MTSEPQVRFVAMCDVLGFKDEVKKASETPNGLSRLASRYRSLINKSQQLAHSIVSTQRLECGAVANWTFGHFVSSDTIFLWSEPINLRLVTAELEKSALISGLSVKPSSAIPERDWDEETRKRVYQSVDKVFFVCLALLMRLSLGCGLPLRIGVAYGECVLDPTASVYIGQPIVDAYFTEQQQEWIGGALHPSCEKAPTPPSHTFLNQLVPIAVDYDIPLKKQGEKGIPRDVQSPLLALNWPAVLDFDGRLEIQLKLEEGLRQHRGRDFRSKWVAAHYFFLTHQNAVAEP